MFNVVSFNSKGYLPYQLDYIMRYTRFSVQKDYDN